MQTTRDLTIKLSISEYLYFENWKMFKNSS